MSCMIVAEAGVNHLGDRAKMLAFCDAAKACGADAVKFQAYDANELSLRRGYFDTNAWAADGHLEWAVIKDAHADTVALLRKAELTDADLDAISAHCKAIGFRWFASVFDPSQVERVLSRGACCLKVSHKESSWMELLDAAAKGSWSLSPGSEQRHPSLWMDYPLLVSVTKDAKAARGIPVHCIAEYPAHSNPELGRVDPNCEFQGYNRNGFSSHYTDYRIPAAAALRGAGYIEAHLKLSDDDPEAAWSLSVDDFGKMVKQIREFESWL